MQKNRILLLLSSLFFFSHANAMEFGKPITTPVQITSQKYIKSTAKKNVVVMNVQLTAEERKNFFNGMINNNQTKLLPYANLPTSITLGMNNVPVLDQGYHGTCVTFATTAAIDAILGKGDYISQLCQLELGHYFADKGYFSSGWNGSYGPWIVDQMIRFGIINKENQKNKTCAGLNDYPLLSPEEPTETLTLDNFREMSEDISEKIYPIYLLSSMQRLNSNYSKKDHTARTLFQIKKALTQGNRVTFGTLLLIAPKCNAGACASYHTQNDTWALTEEINNPNLQIGGHEMVITGYDDNAIAIDKAGIKHQGLLILRNSWGSDVGDQGNFYMTYDYFKHFVMEAAIIAPFNVVQN